MADAVLYEGYVLYPYRASSRKNQVRFQWGVLTPRAFSEAEGSERWSMRTECLVDPGGRPRSPCGSAASSPSTEAWKPVPPGRTGSSRRSSTSRLTGRSTWSGTRRSNRSSTWRRCRCSRDETEHVEVFSFRAATRSS